MSVLFMMFTVFVASLSYSGAFYIWEELKSPILPFVILGAYDLYPVWSWVNNTGVVTVRILPPILPDEAHTKDEMLRKVRTCGTALFIFSIIKWHPVILGLFSHSLLFRMAVVMAG